MRLRNVPGSEEVLAASEYVVNDPIACQGMWREQFQQNAPLHVEIGMGKGRFLTRMAALHPEICYVGMELYSSVLVRALDKLTTQPLDNVRLVCADAQLVTEIFAPGEVDRIYLNFSDPWPKARHAKRRLPSRQFMARFAQILKPEGTIEFKTDNRELFDFALEEFAEAGWEAVAITYDLHHDAAMCEGNVMTEYEEKFSALGNPICKYIIRQGRNTQQTIKEE